jgi:hypothetical protein
MVVRTILKLWLSVRERNKGDNSNLVSAVAYLDTGKYPAWICGYLTEAGNGNDNKSVVNDLHSPFLPASSKSAGVSSVEEGSTDMIPGVDLPAAVVIVS